MKTLLTLIALLLIVRSTSFAGDRWGGPLVDGKEHEYFCKVHVSTWDHKIVRVMARITAEAEQKALEQLQVKSVISIQCTQQDAGPRY